MSLAATSAKLAAFEPVRARLWDFSPTHDRCALELRAETGSVKYLVLLGCLEIHAPTLWTPGKATLSIDGDAYMFQDEIARIRFGLEAQLVDEYAR